MVFVDFKLQLFLHCFYFGLFCCDHLLNLVNLLYQSFKSQLQGRRRREERGRWHDQTVRQFLQFIINQIFNPYFQLLLILPYYLQFILDPMNTI